MTTLILFDKKQRKTVNDDIIEMDLDDLESFGSFKHGEGLVEIPSKKISGKTILEWFAVDGTSFWWFVLPIIHPRYIEAILFIDRLSFFLEHHSVNLIKLNGRVKKNLFFDRIEFVANQVSLNPNPEEEVKRLNAEKAESN